MQWEGDLPLHRHLPSWQLDSGIEPRPGHPVSPRLRDHVGVVGIEENGELRRIEVLLVPGACCLLDAIGVVEDNAQVTDAPHAGLRAYRGLAGLNARVAEDALLGFAAGPVVIDLLVRTARHAHTPAAALVLVDEDNAVLVPLVS